jgi:hypothetical protein
MVSAVCEGPVSMRWRNMVVEVREGRDDVIAAALRLVGTSNDITRRLGISLGTLSIPTTPLP